MRVALIGDSYARGIARGGFAAALRSYRHDLVYAETQPGWSTCQLLRHGALRRALSHTPDAILVSAAHNDAEFEIAACLRRVIALLRASKVKVGWILAASSTRAAVQQHLERNRRILLALLPDTWALFATETLVHGAPRAPDGVHLSQQGYHRLAVAVARHLGAAWKRRAWQAGPAAAAGMLLGMWLSGKGASSSALG